MDQPINVSYMKVDDSTDSDIQARSLQRQFVLLYRDNYNLLLYHTMSVNEINCSIKEDTSSVWHPRAPFPYRPSSKEYPSGAQNLLRAQ